MTDHYGDGALWKLRWSEQVEEMRLWRNLVALHRFAVRIPRGETASAYAPEKTVRVMRIPAQRSKTSAEAEERLFDHLPTRSYRGGRQ